MASQDFFFGDNELEMNSQFSDTGLDFNSQLLALDNLSDCEKPLSDGAEELLNESLKNNGLGDLTGYYPEGAGQHESTPWALTENGQGGPSFVVYSQLQTVSPYEIPVEAPFNYAGGNEAQGMMSLSQSSTNSIDDGIPSIESWKGPYDFSFQFESGTTRKFQFSTTNNKLFCLPSQEIQLFFSYDFGKCRSSEMFISAFLRYKKADCAATPVLRCLNHQMEDENKGDANSFHVLKCTNKNARYVQDPKNERCSVKVKMGGPSPGATNIPKMFKFDCLNSCKPPKLRKKSPVIVVFELYESTKVVGRIAFEVRVCSCPGRDYLKEEHAQESAPKKRKSNEFVDGKDPVDHKRTKIDPETLDHELDSASKARRISEPGILLTPKVEPLQLPVVADEQDLLMSSQESTDDDKDLIPQAKREKFRELIKMTKWILQLSFNPNPILNQLGRNFSRDIRKQTKLGTMLVKNLNVPVICGSRREMIPNGSPDSGINVADPNRGNVEEN